MEDLQKGIYRHYKGGQYRILNEALDSENKEEQIVYQDISDETKIWVRPKKMFLSEVDIKDKKKPRFEFLRPDDELEPLEHQYKRALADYHNLLKQTAKDKTDFIKYALQDFLQEILPVYDHLKLSLLGLKAEDDSNPWAVGVRHVLKQFKDVLESKGVLEIKTVGEKFDHNTMEAMDGTGELVEKEVMPGYMLNGRVIRPAKVIVK